MRSCGLLVLVALCACNGAFGIGREHVVERDAKLFDALADAQPYCATTTGVVPRYSPTLHQVVDQNCNNYQIGGTTAIAWCSGDTGFTLSQGAVDQHLEPIAGIPAPAPSHNWQNARLGPAGDEMFLDDVDLGSFLAVHDTFVPSAGSWVPGVVLPFAGTAVASAPTLGPQRHVLLFTGAAIDEWADDGTNTWQPRQSFDVGMPIVNVAFSPDGLRAVIVAQLPTTEPVTLQVDRATIGDAFGPLTPVPTLPAASDLFITADCARAYMSGAGSIFYALQI